MKRLIKILYLQHAGAIGGSAMSLCYTLEGLDRSRFLPIIGLVKPGQSLRSLYNSIGVQTFDCPDISLFEHSTGLSYRYTNPTHWPQRITQRFGLAGGAAATVHHVTEHNPDLVHLNSVVLLPSAVGLADQKIPFVWHVREHPAHGLMGSRLGFIRQALLALPNQAIFLSDADRASWLGGAPSGIVLPNFVDLAKFDHRLDKSAARRLLGLPQNVPVILFMGGISAIKGTIPFLKSIRILRNKYPSLIALMPTDLSIPPLPLTMRIIRRSLSTLGRGTYHQQAVALINNENLSRHLHIVPKTPNPINLYAACDLLVFPATTPHFSRPVIEAAAMGKPSVAFALPGAGETIIDGETGLLVEPNNVQGLAEAIDYLFSNPLVMHKFGQAALVLARDKFDRTAAINKLQSIYLDVLNAQ